MAVWLPGSGGRSGEQLGRLAGRHQGQSSRTLMTSMSTWRTSCTCELIKNFSLSYAASSVSSRWRVAEVAYRTFALHSSSVLSSRNSSMMKGNWRWQGSP